VENLFERLDRMAAYNPMFCDITWGAGGSTADVTLDIATKMQNMVRRSAPRLGPFRPPPPPQPPAAGGVPTAAAPPPRRPAAPPPRRPAAPRLSPVPSRRRGALPCRRQICVDTMMHLTCTNMPVESLETTLKQCKESGIRNILALRGDPPKGQENFEAVEGGFSCALDLVKYIRCAAGQGQQQAAGQQQGASCRRAAAGGQGGSGSARPAPAAAARRTSRPAEPPRPPPACSARRLARRQEFGDYFGICVAGYPEAHPDYIVDDKAQMEANYRDSLAYTKAKVRGWAAAGGCWAEGLG
jgi:5,10-methylenetetrahydrofolate reductase